MDFGFEINQKCNNMNNVMCIFWLGDLFLKHITEKISNPLITVTLIVSQNMTDFSQTYLSVPFTGLQISQVGSPVYVDQVGNQQSITRNYN